MIAEEYLVQLPEWPQIGERYQQCLQLMEEKVIFSLAESPIHTKTHCARILLYALLIGAHTQLDERTYLVVAYHDRDDMLGLRILKERFADDPCVALLYQIFKDADALDRFRLGPNALDAKYLRTE